MSFLDRIFGRDRQPEPASTPAGRAGESPTDEQALARYRYMLRTAPPEAIEQAHAEAFAKLSPAQRAQVLRELGDVVPARERAVAEAGGYEPRAMARVATRAELRQPGAIERSLGGFGGGMGMGGMLAGTLLGSLAAGFVGSLVAHQFLDMLTPDALDQIDHGLDPAPPAETFADTGAGDADAAEGVADDEFADGYDAPADELGGDFDLGDDLGGDVGEF